MPESNEMAPGEIARSLTRLERGLEQLADTIRNLDVIHRTEYQAHRDGDDKRLEAIEQDVGDIVSDLRTNRRLVLASLIFPVLVMVFGVILAVVFGSPGTT